MRSNIIKYIFILFVIGIIGFAIYKVNYKTEKVEENNIVAEAQTEENIIRNMRIGIAKFDNINPLISQNRDVINLSTIIYEPLLTVTSDYKIELALAKEWSKVSETIYIVKLRDGLKWDDDTSITGGDVKYTIERLKEGKSVYSKNVKNISSVEIIDGLTVRLNLKKEQPFFEYNLIFPIVSSRQFEKEKNFYKSRKAPIASGMYKVKSAATDSMELEKNDKWYKSGKVDRKIDNIKINFYATMGDAYNSFKIGNIDMICTLNTKISDYIGTIGFTTKDYKGRELDFISLNCENSILSDKKVRQAINYAISRKKINSTIFGNERFISSFPLDYGNYLYPKESKSNFNKDKAEKALEDAGWSYRYGRWRKTENYRTETLRLNLVVQSNNKTRVKVAEFIEEQLENIGISVNVYYVSNSSYKSYLKNKNYDMILTGIYNGYSPDLSYFLGDNNIANYDNNEVKGILNDVKNITDEKALKEKYNRLIEIYEDEVPYICLYRNKLKVVYSVKLSGEFNPTSYTAYYNFEKWYKN